VGSGQGDVVQQLLAAHADPDAQNEFGDTPLIIASRRGDLGLVRRLLEAGAGSRLRNRDHSTAADIAQARGFHKIAEVLEAS
jgi:ankyrin repeat protein